MLPRRESEHAAQDCSGGQNLGPEPGRTETERPGQGPRQGTPDYRSPFEPARLEHDDHSYGVVARDEEEEEEEVVDAVPARNKKVEREKERKRQRE